MQGVCEGRAGATSKEQHGCWSTHMPGRCTTYAEPIKMAGTSAAAYGAGSLIEGATPSAITLYISELL